MTLKLSNATTALALALLIGGATGAHAGDNVSSTAYREVLSDPSRLTPQSGGDGALIWVDPKADFAAYNAILIDHIHVRLADDADKDIDPTALKTLTDYLHTAIVEALTPAYQIATKPGPGVLTARIWITELIPTKTEYSVATLIIPYATVLDLASGAASGESLGQAPYLGRTGIAGELVDSQTGQVVAAYADGEVGTKYVIDTKDGIGDAVSKGFGNYLKAYSTWDYAKQAFASWAQGLRNWLNSTAGR